MLAGEGDDGAAGFTEPAGVAYGVAGEGAVSDGEGEHLAEDDLHVLGCAGMVLGDLAEQPVETPDAGLSDPQVDEHRGECQHGRQRDLGEVLGSDDVRRESCVQVTPDAVGQPGRSRRLHYVEGAWPGQVEHLQTGTGLLEADDRGVGNDDPIARQKIFGPVAVAERLRAGRVSVNDGVVTDVRLPFGGFGRSGIGREFGFEGVLEYTEVQTLQW
ncbi:aldehyde dehydrogenase family protein [Solwaraspora sp. WMMB762]|uniref:aldehyde dehydrogenase family protein n=1 Tax=Solwaraspora sp. WMMB762 TaxID=3404120 RepID=UPI003B950CFF